MHAYTNKPGSVQQQVMVPLSPWLFGLPLPFSRMCNAVLCVVHDNVHVQEYHVGHVLKTCNHGYVLSK